MPQSKKPVEFNQFVKGLITEASPLTFPDNASLAEDNMVLNRDGSRQRRLGMDYESGFAKEDSSALAAVFDSYSLSTHDWPNAGNDPSVTITVVQVGDVLDFFDATATSPSATKLGSVTIPSFSGDVPVQTTVISGTLIVTYGGTDVQRVEYDPTGGTFTLSSYTLSTRDLWGIDDGLDVDNRPVALSTSHNYNLLNQGWDTTRITSFQASQSVYPSNADIWFQGKDSSDNFDPALLVKQDFGTSSAPRGRFIIDVVDRSTSRDTESGLSTIPDASVNGGIFSVATFAGRVFYGNQSFQLSGGDDNSPNLNTLIFFSQVVDFPNKLGNCYQEADLTNEFDPLLVATDGGFISIPEMAGVLKMVPTKESLIIFSETGVWEIKGDEGGFRATSFQVVKLSNIGAVNAESIIEAEDKVFYWSDGGIYVIVQDQTSFVKAAQNLSERTIQTFYLSISNVGKDNATGFYDETAKKVRWLYNDTSSYDGVTERHKYNRELVFDLILTAFYTNTIGEISGDSPYAAGFIKVPNFTADSFEDPIVVNSDPVVVNGDPVVITKDVRGRGAASVKYLTVVPRSGLTTQYTFSSFVNGAFADWVTEDSTGVDAAAFLETGNITFGESARQKQVPVIVVHCQRTETGFTDIGGGDFDATNPSSCLMTAKWDFTDNAIANKQSTQTEVYRLKRNFIVQDASDEFVYGYEVISTRNKLRGRGRSVRLRFDSSAANDLHLLGWSIDAAANQAA